MSLRFELEIALLGVAAVVALERALNVDRVRVVPLDQVAVIAVHRAHERCQRGQQACRQRPAEAGAALGQFEREIGQFGPMARPLAQDERLHQGDALASVLCRF